jgi:hypothetical protein
LSPSYEANAICCCRVFAWRDMDGTWTRNKRRKPEAIRMEELTSADPTFAEQISKFLSAAY